MQKDVDDDDVNVEICLAFVGICKLCVREIFGWAGKNYSIHHDLMWILCVCVCTLKRRSK